MEKIWLANYDPGVPTEIDPDQYPSLVHLYSAIFSQFPQQSCFRSFGVSLSYQQIDRLSNAFACYLQNHCHLQPGDRVAIMLPNLLQYPVALFGVHKAGCVVVNVNPLYTARELKTILQDSGAKCVLVLANFAKVLAEVLAQTLVEHIIVTEIGDLLGFIKGSAINFAAKYLKNLVPAWDIPDAHSFKKILHGAQKFNPCGQSGEAIAFLQYTGGTTGGQKGAILTHRNMVANILQARAWLQLSLEQLRQHKEITADSGIITALPLYHIFSLTANFFTFFVNGVANILISNPRDLQAFTKVLKQEDYWAITGVNTLFSALLSHAHLPKFCYAKFRLALGGGMAVQKNVCEQWLLNTGAPIIQAYGLTEASPAVCIEPFATTKQFTGSIGLPLPSTEVKICDDHGQTVVYGLPGELYVRGPQVMKGYWNKPEVTASIFDSEGWLKTGDIATIDSKGFLRLVDRKKDLIIISGFNVYPNEVEEVIAAIPGVAEVAVIGLPSSHGESIKAYVVSKDSSLTAEKIIAYCHQQLTGYKVPKEIEFRHSLPHSSVGKVLRRVLRDEAAEK